MRSDTLAHWLAAVGAASLIGSKIRWDDAGALLEVGAEPPLNVSFAPSLAPLLATRGRRDFRAGARRALDHLSALPAHIRRSEWEHLRDGETTPIVIATANRPNGWDRWSLGTLHPGSMTGAPVSAWLPLLAYQGASQLNRGRQKWQKLQSQHPDLANQFWAIRPSAWVTPAEIAEWYHLAASAVLYDLRPTAGDLMSYCATL